MRFFSPKRIATQIAILSATILTAVAIIPLGTTAQQTPAPAQTKSTAPAAQTLPATKTTNPAGTSSTTPAKKPAPKPAAPPPLTTDKQKDSYALGVYIGRGFAQQPIDLDITTLLRGLRDTLQGTKPQLTDDQIKAALAQLQNQANTKAQAANQALGEANLKTGQEFLAENKGKEGVVELPSGLQYKVITMGTGPKPTAADTVVSDYSGTLIDGKEFDSSYKRGQPASFPVSGVIKGWTEALQLMPVGSKWQLFIPANLAYGASGRPSIPPNAALIFIVELHSIEGSNQ